MEIEKTVRVVIAAKPGIMRNSLLSFLRAISTAQIVALADDAQATLGIVCQHKPQLVIIDSNLSEDLVIKLIEQINAEQPTPEIIVLVENLRQQERCLKAGARQALLKGFLDEKLGQAVRLGENQ